MTSEARSQEFMSREIVMKLHNELKDADSKTQIDAFLEYVESVKDRFDEKVIAYQSQKEIGFIHFHHQEYLEALPFLEKAAKAKSADRYSKHLIYIILIRINRFLKRSQESLFWTDEALKAIKVDDSAFRLVDVLKEYADLCKDASLSFDLKYEPLIHTIVKELGFPVKELEPLEYVFYLGELNHYWNIRLCRLHIKEMAKEEKKNAFQEFIETCEIRWYQDYAQKIVDSLE